MKTRAAWALAAVLCLAGSGRAAETAVPALPAAYDAKAAPLDALSKELLTGNGYELRDDGLVWDKINEAPVVRTDMPYLLSRLASARRLKALLQINNIITRYDAERKLTAEDKETVRQIARANWIVFGVGPRHDFRSYFSVEELETLDKIPARFESMGTVTMTDPLPESVTSLPPESVTAAPVPAAPAPVAPAPVVAPPAPSTAPAVSAATAPVPAAPVPVVAPPAPPQAVAAVAAAPAAAAAVAKVIPTLTPMMDLPSLKRDSPFAPAAPPPPPAPVSAPAAVPAPAPPAPAAGPVLATPDIGTLKPWTPPAPSTAPAVAPPEPVAPVAVATAAAIAPPPPEPPKPAVIGAADYEKFVAEGPYTKDGKALLALIGKRAPDYCLPLLRRTVVGAVPQIAIDGARTGAGLRAGLILGADPRTPPVAALSPGPLMVEVKTGLFGGREAVLLPESPEAWTDLGAPRPALDALRADAPSKTDNGDWGAVRVFADGSRRGTYSSDEQAGELLEQLLRLGLAREGLNASEYAARRWARTARLLFEARLKDEMKADGFLDPDRRAELRSWLDRPEEADDDAVAAWAGSRVQAFDPRRGPPDAARDFDARAGASCGRAALEDALVSAARRRARRVGALETLVDAGLIDGAAAKSSAQAAADEEAAARAKLLASPPACAAPDAKRDEGLRKASVLLAKAARAERALREAKAGDSHTR